MANIPEPLWRSDPIEYLVQKRFPLTMKFVLEQREGRKSASTAAKNKERVNEANAYRLHLKTLTPSQLSALVAKTQADDSRLRQARANFEEQQRIFNRPNANADFAYWATASYWSKDEAVALSLGRDPRLVTWNVVEPYVSISPFAKSFADLREIVRRAIVMGQIFDSTIPTIFLAWAERMGLEVPVEMRAAVENLGLQIRDWKTLSDQRQEVIDLLEERIRLVEERNTDLTQVISDYHETAQQASERFNAVLAGKDGQIAELKLLVEGGARKSASKRERQSLLRLVIGMAIKGYAYNPKATRT